ncbi:hypothetical protein NDU88_001357 [Pleurodeles waltl]|uniref:Uncharacterized protein n=1 Tax=Pleurodeles waltl TaxID=8319 RepID=A0AAV7THM5_PLEWA|nr:hypothetical protein NDU88_001357 [Pleurodeles waltl]
MATQRMRYKDPPRAASRLYVPVPPTPPSRHFEPQREGEEHRPSVAQCSTCYTFPAFLHHTVEYSTPGSLPPPTSLATHRSKKEFTLKVMLTQAFSKKSDTPHNITTVEDMAQRALTSNPDCSERDALHTHSFIGVLISTLRNDIVTLLEDVTTDIKDIKRDIIETGHHVTNLENSNDARKDDPESYQQELIDHQEPNKDLQLSLE